MPGPETDRLATISAETGAQIVAGVIERAGGTLHCSALFFSPTDGLFAKYRKLMPTAGERYLWGQGDGSTPPAVTTNFAVLGAAICWENYMPLLRQAMYAKGVLYRAVIVRMRWHQPTIDYVTRRTQEGLSKREIIRCLIG